MTPGLAALVDPGIAELRARIASDEPFVVHGVGASIAELVALPFLASLDALLDAWPDLVNVHLPDVADEASTITASPHDARKLFANGMGLLFDDAQRYAPRLGPWLDAIRADLGLSALTQQRCLVYATPAAGGTAAHFDQNVNFVVQLHGTKTWWLARNTHVTQPLTRHTIGQPVDPELSTYARLPMPDELPASRVEIVLEPGSVLYVPRGTWHATRATTAALSLNFTFSPPTWIDVFTAALRSRLALASGWRATAAPLAIASFDALLRELADEAPHWHAADILAATEGT
ncbi:MAG: cupin-like domain-containing protein [Proteobacteria bacterium]|nr:cupin-like domain-containing protein [Pseudomonadota bacterium]